MKRVLGILLVTLTVATAAFAQEKKRVAVLDFDYGTVRSAVQAYFGTDQDVGKGISLLLEQKLVQDGKFRVIDRNAMDKILKEQNFSNSDRVDPTSAAKIGRIFRHILLLFREEKVERNGNFEDLRWFLSYACSRRGFPADWFRTAGLTFQGRTWSLCQPRFPPLPIRRN